MKVLICRYTCRNCGYQGINIDQKTCLACGGRTKNTMSYEDITVLFRGILKEIALLDRKIREMGERFVEAPK